MSLSRSFARITASSLLSFFLMSSLAYAAEAPEILSENAIIVDIGTNEVLYEKAADEQVSIASLTKLMVAYVAFQELNMSDVVTVSSNAVATEGSSAFLMAGERMEVDDLLTALLVPSGNDAAMAFAEFISGTEVDFLSLMNEQADLLGMEDTQYGSAPGFDTAEGYSTARDLVILAEALLDYPVFRDIIQSQTASVTSLDGTVHNFTSTNQILGDSFSGLTVTGMKTGTTDGAGQCLIILAEDVNGNEVLIVLLGSTDRYADAQLLLDWIGTNFTLDDAPDPVDPVEENPYTTVLTGWPFPDLVSYENRFFEALVYLKEEGLVKGDDSTAYVRGVDPLNRAELVTLLLRAAGYSEEDTLACAELHGTLSSSAFSDVPLDSWYANAVHCAANLGWVSGDDLPEDAPEGTLPSFRPADNVNLAEAAKLLITAELGEPAASFAGSDWYDLYLNYLSYGDLIRESDEDESFTLSWIAYDLDFASSSISRGAAFELLYRIRQSEITDGAAIYDPTLNLEDYQAAGATVELLDDGLHIVDPNLGFELSGIPVGDYELDELRFWIQNPSGVENDYYSKWSLLYPNTESDNVALIHVLVTDPDYLNAYNSGGEETQGFCSDVENDWSEDLILVWAAACEGKGLEEGVSLN